MRRELRQAIREEGVPDLLARYVSIARGRTASHSEYEAVLMRAAEDLLERLGVALEPVPPSRSKSDLAADLARDLAMARRWAGWWKRQARKQFRAEEGWADTAERAEALLSAAREALRLLLTEAENVRSTAQHMTTWSGLRDWYRAHPGPSEGEAAARAALAGTEPGPLVCSLCRRPWPLAPASPKESRRHE